MANDTAGQGQGSFETDTTPNGGHDADNLFADMQHDDDEDSFFGAVQVAQAGPVLVPVPSGEHIIRVQVNPGEILELASPFDPGAHFEAREADGNLAIKVGDVTVILLGYSDAYEKAPVIVEASNGQPLDIAVIVAETNPDINIQTAAGLGQTGGEGGQGAENTGGILTEFGGGEGLGGLNAVGKQDETELGYKLIDSNLRQVPEFLLSSDLSSSGSGSGGGGSGGSHGGLQEPFLRDPFHTDTFTSFDDFLTQYQQYINANQGNTGGWADFDGTEVTSDDFDAFLTKTMQTITISHSSPDTQVLDFNVGDFFDGAIPTSNGEQLEARPLQGDPTDEGTVLLVRPSDGAIIMVFHVEESDGTTGDFHVDAYLINRLDHATNADPNDKDQDTLSIGFKFDFVTPEAEQQPEPGHGKVDILDDVPIVGDPTYFNVLHPYSIPTGTSVSVETLVGGGGNVEISHTSGKVDEDWLSVGNNGLRDTDNTNGLPDKDVARGDNIGDTYVCGFLNINFGADGPAGFGDDDCRKESPALVSLLVDPAYSALALENIPPVGDPYPSSGSQLTSGDNPLVVLSHDTVNGVETLVVGYYPATEKDAIFAFESGGSCEPQGVNVFQLTLNVDPNNPDFQKFEFDLYLPLDHPTTNKPESDINLVFGVIGHDDDTDAVHTSIKIDVNDDVPHAVADSANAYFILGIAAVDSDVPVLPPAQASGNVLTNDQGVDRPFVVTAAEFETDTSTKGQVGDGPAQIQGEYGLLTIYANGEFNYQTNNLGAGGTNEELQQDVFTYFMKDNDGDPDSATLTITIGGLRPVFTLTSLSVPDSGDAAPSYDVERSVNGNWDASYHSPFTGASFHVTDDNGGHNIQGDSGDDLIQGNGGNDRLDGHGGDDRLEGGDGRDNIQGGSGDDQLFGGNNADELQGERGNDTLDGGAGADKMNGGSGDDLFANVDAADLDGTRLFADGHSIDGGKGTDTVDLSGLSSFDSTQASKMENVEVLSFVGGSGTAASLNYDAAYGITQVGGIHSLTIHGDADDTVTLTPSGGNSWTHQGTDSAGNEVYVAGPTGAQVTVVVDHAVHVEAS